MITCVVDYVIDPSKIGDFERFGRRWIELVELHGGRHHGYFLGDYAFDKRKAGAMLAALIEDRRCVRSEPPRVSR